MIQDIEPYRIEIPFCNDAQIEEDDVCVCFEGDKILILKESGRLPVFHEIFTQIESHVYLFRIAEKKYHLIQLKGEVPTDFRYCDVIEYEHKARRVDAFGAVTAYHLYVWYRNNQYCGRCGNKMRHSKSERAMVCDSCNNTIYPRISPAVIVAVTDGERLLLTKYNGRRHKRYALVAGFVEIGETVEDAVRREVMEEVGLKVRKIRYYKSQPWGQNGDLLMGFFAEAYGDKRIQMDTGELSEAAWHDRKEIDFRDEGISLTAEMIRVFMQGGKMPKEEI